MTFSHEDALNGAPVWCGLCALFGTDFKWNPYDKQWELDGTEFWNSEGLPIKGNKNPSLTTKKPGT